MLVAGRDMDFWLLAERCVESSSPDARAEAPIAKRDGPAVEDGEVAIERPVVDDVPRRMQEQADVLCPLDGCWQRVRCVVSIMRPKMCVLRLGADDGREADKNKVVPRGMHVRARAKAQRPESGGDRDPHRHEEDLLAGLEA